MATSDLRAEFVSVQSDDWGQTPIVRARWGVSGALSPGIRSTGTDAGLRPDGLSESVGAAMLKLRSCARGVYPTPSGPEGSSGQYYFSVPQDSLGGVVVPDVLTGAGSRAGARTLNGVRHQCFCRSN